MPYKKKQYKKKPRARKKYNTHNKWRGSRYTSIQRQPAFSDSQVVTLKYADQVALNAGAGTKAYDTWSLANINDPYTAAGGHQPMGHDEWSNFYKQYQVLGAKVTVYATQYLANSPGVLQSQMIYLQKKDVSGTVGSTVNDMMEQSLCKYKICTGKDGSASTVKLVDYYSPKKWFGIKNIRDCDDLQAQIGTGPVRDCFIEVGAVPLSSTDDPGALHVNIVIEYIVLLSQRLRLTSS